MIPLKYSTKSSTKIGELYELRFFRLVFIMVSIGVTAFSDNSLIILYEFQVNTLSVSHNIHLYNIYNMNGPPFYDMVPSKWEYAHFSCSCRQTSFNVSCTLNSIVLSGGLGKSLSRHHGWRWRGFFGHGSHRSHSVER